MLVMAAATSGFSSDMVAGFIIGCFAVGFIWLIVAGIRMGYDGKHELHHQGMWYNTRKAHRIFGVSGQRVNGDGQWIQWVKSIWRTYYDKYSKTHHYFILQLDELQPAKIVPVTKEKAQEWINKHADKEHARKLIDEWFREPEEAKPVQVYHDHH